jgi:hypothetical protein
MLRTFLSSRNIRKDTMDRAEAMILRELSSHGFDATNERATSGIVRRLTSLFEEAASGGNLLKATAPHNSQKGRSHPNQPNVSDEDDLGGSPSVIFEESESGTLR